MQTIMPAKIHALPAETILQICNYLSQEDVAKFRLSCRRHADLGVERLVKELHLMFSHNSCFNLCHIAERPAFAKYVKSIFYEGAMANLKIDHDIWELLVGETGDFFRMPPEPKFPHECRWTSSMLRWERKMQDWEALWKRFRGRSDLQAFRGWTACVRIQKETAEIIQTDLDRKLVEFAFEYFPNLEEVNLQTDNKATEAMKRTFRDAEFLPTSQIPPGSSAQYYLDHSWSGTRHLSSLLEASVAAGHKLRRLTAANLNWSLFGPGVTKMEWLDTACAGYAFRVEQRFMFQFEDDDWWFKPYHKGLESAFYHLTHLDFRFNASSFDPEEDFQVVQLGEAICSAKNLRNLALDFGNTETVVDLEMLIDKSPFQRVIWPHLTFLELNAVTAKHIVWIAFIDAHSATLCNIHLRSLGLLPDDEDNNGNWGQTLLAMHKILRGKNVEFRGVFCVEDSWSAENVDEEEMDMDMNIGFDDQDSSKRFGNLLQQWFLDDLGTNDSFLDYHARFLNNYDPIVDFDAKNIFLGENGSESEYESEDENGIEDEDEADLTDWFSLG